jgi:hypothetical protein
MGTKTLTVDESLDFIGKYLQTARSYLVRDISEIRQTFPLVLKIVSPDAVHKTEFRGVRIVKDLSALNSEFNDLISIAKKHRLKIRGILVQEFIRGKEVIIGIKKDPSFGHVIMFGLGGIMVELLKDVSFRVCPISESDAGSMIDDLKGKGILAGFRGEPAVNLSLLKKILVKASYIPAKNPSIVELDINPLIINEKDAFVVDSRLVLG